MGIKLEPAPFLILTSLKNTSAISHMPPIAMSPGMIPFAMET